LWGDYRHPVAAVVFDEQVARAGNSYLHSFNSLLPDSIYVGADYRLNRPGCKALFLPYSWKYSNVVLGFVLGFECRGAIKTGQGLCDQKRNNAAGSALVVVRQ
jgi:hypothetical protein